MGIFYPNFLMLLPPPRPVTCFAPPLQAFLPLLAVDGCSPSDAFSTFCSAITGILDPCGPSMGVLPLMHFSHVFAPPLQAFLSSVGS